MTILEEAGALVAGVRQEAYGDPSEMHAKIAAIWSVILGHEVSPRQVALCLAGMKLARESHRHKRDNLVDLAAYAHLADVVGD